MVIESGAWSEVRVGVWPRSPFDSEVIVATGTWLESRTEAKAGLQSG